MTPVEKAMAMIRRVSPSAPVGEFVATTERGCDDCSMVWPFTFMVADELWLSVCDKKERLCMDCLSVRLGWQLTVGDLRQEVPCNWQIFEVFGYPEDFTFPEELRP